ncbi:MAG: spore protease YyaC [Patescibacteria group bacterium]
MWNPFARLAPEEAAWQAPQRIHVDHASAEDLFRRQVGFFLRRFYSTTRALAVLCIGTDRSTGDCLGPLIGSKLSAGLPERVRVLGTLDRPVHAVNLAESMDDLRAWEPDAFVIAIDACLGRTESVGYISLKEGPLQPGTGVNKSLPAVGDFHIIGIVNVGGFMEYLVLQNTRLSLVMRMAEIIARGLHDEIWSMMGGVPAAAMAPAYAAAETAAAQPRC